MIRAGAALALVATMLAAAAAPAARAAEYWYYARNDMEVHAAGRADDAIEVARRLAALDTAMKQLLRLPNGGAGSPTSVYLLSNEDLAAIDPVWAAQGGAFFRAAPFDDYLVLASDHGAAATSELYAARTLVLLSGWGLARMPDWYRQGVAQLAAGVVFGADRLTIGQDVADLSGRVARGWIPMEKIMRLSASDPEFRHSPEALAQYQAQCWWLVHLMLIDRVLDPAISQYVERLMAGQTQETAFLNSFAASYEQIDDYFRKVRRNVQLKTYAAELPAADDHAAARAVAEGDFRAIVAQLALMRDPRSAQGAQWAREVLAAEPENEQAQLAVARVEFAARRYPETDAMLQRLHARAELPGASRRELAELELLLARQREDALPGTQELDALKIRAAARADLQRALEADPNDLRALYQLSWLQATAGDVVAVRTLLPAVEAAFFRRPDSPELAALLVRMCSMGGTPAEVFKYSVAQQRLAVTEAERAGAAARVQRLRSQVQPPQ